MFMAVVKSYICRYRVELFVLTSKADGFKFYRNNTCSRYVIGKLLENSI